MKIGKNLTGDVKMGCWKWFNDVLKEAGVEVTDKNKMKIDDVIHQYISEQASYGRCSPNWSTAKKQVLGNEQMKKELIQKLKTVKA
jgi:predicted Fe-Mo cluster-binding NifX family protein